MKAIPLATIAFSLITPLGAATVFFGGTLQGSQENPPNTSTATGLVELTVDSDTFAWTLTGAFSGLESASSAAHIHGPAAPGTNAGVLVPLTYTSGATSGTLSGSGTFSQGVFDDLTAGLLYVNLHTIDRPGGEIRAQLVPEASAAALGALACLFLLCRRRC